MSGSAENTPNPSRAAQKALPVALERFLTEIAGTKEEVYSTLLRTIYKGEKRTRAEWQEILSSLGPRKVTY